MNRKEKIQQEIQKTLDCFDQVEPLKANPFFYTRLQSRINDLNRNKWQLKRWKFVWGVLKPALLIFVVAVNILTAIVVLKSQNNNQYSRTQLLNAFAQEMTLDSNQYNPNLLINE